MEILRASNMGFCFGVKRAVQMLEKASEEGPLDSLGGVVHNKQVVERLAERGVSVAKDLEEVKGKRAAITAHGVGPNVLEKLHSRGLEIVDTTCPIVRVSQKAAKKLTEEGFFLVVYGDARHPEVKGVLNWAGGDGIAAKDASFLSFMERPPKRIGIVSQTTQPPGKFTQFVNSVMDRCLREATEIRVVNTICDATTHQQEAAMELARKVELMLVVGGHHSANTKHLAEICAAQGVETHHIEGASEISPSWLADKNRLGVTAGASTPEETVEEVIAHLKTLASSQQAGYRVG